MTDSLKASFFRPVDREEKEVSLAKQRDAGVWGLWYDRYYGLLYKYAFARLGQREEAEDVAAQVFLQALKGIDSFKYRGRPILAWLYRIAHNLVMDRHRRSPRSQPLDALQESPASEASVGLDNVIESLRLNAALARLTEEQRDVLILRYQLGMSSREVAAVLGKSPAAVYSLQVRATAAMRKLLSEPIASGRPTKTAGRGR